MGKLGILASAEKVRGRNIAQELVVCTSSRRQVLGSGTYAALVENLESVPPRYVDRARTTLKCLIGEVRLIPEGEYVTAELELEGARLLAAADANKDYRHRDSEPLW